MWKDVSIIDPLLFLQSEKTIWRSTTNSPDIFDFLLEIFVLDIIMIATLLKNLLLNCAVLQRVHLKQHALTNTS